MTIKPSTELLIGCSEPVYLLREHRLAIATEINAASDLNLKILGENKKGELKSTIDVRSQKINVSGTMQHQVTNFEYGQYYDDKKDDELTRNFFYRLQEAGSSFLTDIDIDQKRPTPSKVSKKIDQTYKAAERLDKHLRDIDDRTRDLLINEDIDVELTLSHLDKLLLACEVLKDSTPSAKIHARTNLCLAVISALFDLGLKVTTSRYGLVDSIVKHLAKASTGGKIIDIQDNIRAAMVIHRQLSK